MQNGEKGCLTIMFIVVSLLFIGAGLFFIVMGETGIGIGLIIAAVVLPVVGYLIIRHRVNNPTPRRTQTNSNVTYRCSRCGMTYGTRVGKCKKCGANLVYIPK